MSQVAIQSPLALSSSIGLQTRLEKIGATVSRYGLILPLLLIGLLKFTPQEAAGIQPLVALSPFMSWMYNFLSVQTVSKLIGLTELIVAAMLASRPFTPKLSFYGSLGAIVIFASTLSFLFSTPGAIQLHHGLPVLGDTGQFLIKDVALLGASIWTAAEALKASQFSPAAH